MAATEQISGLRCRTPPTLSCAWSRPDGTSRRPAGPTATTPPWWCIWMSRTRPLDCIWVRCCGATRGLHAHHIRHWEDGGPTELANLVLLCPYHHRLHHRGIITIAGPPEDLSVTDSAGRALSPGSLARPPTRPPPAVEPCPGPTGERADWWWYEPFQPQPPPTLNSVESAGPVTVGTI